jgi:hypothetical protein
MKNIFAKQKEVEFVSVQSNWHSWRFIGMEMEALGRRLDAARVALSQSRSEWARWYWTETLDRLMIQWRQLPALHDGEAKMTLLPRWTVSYNYYQTAQEVGNGYDISDKLFDKIFKANLDESWHRIRDERIMKCNCQ